MTLSSLAAGAPVAELLAVNGGMVGASTGFMAARGDWPALAAEARRISTSVLELSALSLPELPSLLAFVATGSELGFGTVSVHGPAKGLSGHAPAEIAAALTALPEWVDGIVMHPEKLGAPEAYSVLGPRLRLENMDTRKHDGRTTGQLARYFECLPEARFCFDVAHAKLNDPSMSLARELLDAFGDRLAEVHVSSIEPSGFHVPLRPDDLELYWPVLSRCVGVPWVLEAAPA